MKRVPIIKVRPIRGVFDSDWDGVPNDMDCQWWNPHKQDRELKRENTKIRNPVKYLVEKYGVPKHYAEQFLAQSALHKYWKKDASGHYINKETLNSIGYGWKKERKEFMKTLRPPISHREKMQMHKTLFPSYPTPKDLESDPLVRKYLQKGEELKQRLDELSDADKAIKIREIKKLWRKAIKDLVKKYPKQKAKLESLFKKQLEEFDIRIRMWELTKIGSRRQWTKKESNELENLYSRFKKVAESKQKA